MNASQQIYTVLTGDAGVSAFGATIRPVKLEDTDTLPAIVYTIVSTDPTGSLQGDTSRLDHVRVQIDAWTDNYDEAVALGGAIRDALRGRVPLVDTPQAPSDTLRARFIDENPTFDSGRKRHRWSADYYVWQTP